MRLKPFFMAVLLITVKIENSVTRHKANYASGSSFTLLLVCRLQQNLTIGQIINQLISRKCAE